MKKFLKYLLLFFGVVIIIDVCVGYACDYMRHHTKPGPIKQFDDLCLKDEHDILIMGSSRAHHHYVPMIFEDSLGLDVYNVGVDGNGVVLAYGILQMVTKRYSPKMIIYDVEQSFDIYYYKNDNNCTRYLALLKPYYREANVAGIFKDISKQEYYKVHFGLYRYNSSVIQLVKEFCIPSTVFYKGYEPAYGTMTEEPRYFSNSNSISIVDTLKIGYFKRFVDLCDYYDIPLIVVVSPQYGTNCSDRYDPIKSICQENQVAFVDYYSDNEFISHKEFFKDPMHLNEEGASMFSRKVVSDIKPLLSFE